MYMMIGYSLICLMVTMYAANNDEIEKRYARVKLKLAYQGDWCQLWDLSQGYKEYHLLQALQACDWQKVRKIVAKHYKDISLDVWDDKGNFPLWRAVQAKKHDIIQLLLEHGADPNQTFYSEDRDINTIRANGCTALFEAIYQSDIQTALLLLDKGASLHVVNEVGSTPLLAAVQANCVAMVQLLLRRGANPNVQEKIFCLDRDRIFVSGGDTPLIVAVIKNNMEMINVLLSGGAKNMHVMNAAGQTALSISKMHPDKQMFDLLSRIDASST